CHRIGVAVARVRPDSPRWPCLSRLPAGAAATSLPATRPLHGGLPMLVEDPDGTFTFTFTATVSGEYTMPAQGDMPDNYTRDSDSDRTSKLNHSHKVREASALCLPKPDASLCLSGLPTDPTMASLSDTG